MVVMLILFCSIFRPFVLTIQCALYCLEDYSIKVGGYNSRNRRFRANMPKSTTNIAQHIHNAARRPMVSAAQPMPCGKIAPPSEPAATTIAVTVPDWRGYAAPAQLTIVGKTGPRKSPKPNAAKMPSGGVWDRRSKASHAAARPSDHFTR